jgi:cell division protein FtsI (penicillin-binding protein 3)
MTSAFATIANNGIRVQPHIVKEVRSSNDKPAAFTQVSQTQIVSVETARRLKTMLKEVVISGTGKKAQVEGFSAAGKTGTAWKFDPKTKTIDSSKYVSSFIGMAPADDPEIVISVVMDEPKAGGRDGGSAAAPVFSEVAQGVLKALSVSPDQPGKPKADAVAQTQGPEIAPVTPVADSKPVVRTKPVATIGNRELKPPAARSIDKQKPVVETKPDTKPAAAKPPAEKRDSGTHLPSRKRFET